MTPGEIDRHIELILQKQTQFGAEIRNLRNSVMELSVVVTKLLELSGGHFARLDEDRLADLAGPRGRTQVN